MRGGGRDRRTTRKENEIQKERSIERVLYDWTFRAFLRKGRAGTRVLLAKTKERRLGGPSPPSRRNGPRNCPTAFIYASNRGKRCKPLVCYIPAFDPARLDRDIISLEDI